MIFIEKSSIAAYLTIYKDNEKKRKAEKKSM